MKKFIVDLLRFFTRSSPSKSNNSSDLTVKSEEVAASSDKLLNSSPIDDPPLYEELKQVNPPSYKETFESDKNEQSLAIQIDDDNLKDTGNIRAGTFVDGSERNKQSLAIQIDDDNLKDTGNIRAGTFIDRSERNKQSLAIQKDDDNLKDTGNIGEFTIGELTCKKRCFDLADKIMESSIIIVFYVLMLLYIKMC